MKSSILRKSTGVVALIVSSASLVILAGCNDRDVATGIGSAAIGAGVAAVVIGNNNGGYGHGRRDYSTVCTRYYDYYGRPYEDCRTGSYNRYNEEVNMESGVLVSEKNSALTPEEFAAEFHLSFASSTKLVNSLRQAKTGNNTGLIELGLTADNLTQMSKFDLPDASAIDRLSKNLNVNKTTTTTLLNRLQTWALNEKTKKCNEVKYSDDQKDKEFFSNYCN